MINDIFHPKRYLNLDGSYNIRDIGGYSNPNGQQTKWNRFYRSGTMHQLTSKSQDKILESGIRTIIDLRTPKETKSTPNVFANSSELQFNHIDMIGDADSPEANAPSEPAAVILEGPEKIMVSYTSILENSKSQIHDILTLISDPTALPLIYHCQGGKDRTGLVTAMILGIVGVSTHVIADDYALTAHYLLDRYFKEFAKPDESSTNFTWRNYQEKYCPPKVMSLVLDYMNSSYGSVEGYIKSTGITDSKIQLIRNNISE